VKGRERGEKSPFRILCPVSSLVVILPDAWALAPLHHFFVGEA